jgi:hypothetical protein
MSQSGVVFRKKSGRRSLPKDELRTHCVSVRLNDAELAELDRARRRFQRGEAMRMLALTSLPTPIIVSEVNQKLAADIGRSFGNLATVATVLVRV